MTPDYAKVFGLKKYPILLIDNMREEVESYFQTGQTSFRYFEWLNVTKRRGLYPKRWKILIIDFVSTYLRLCLTVVLLILACLITINGLVLL